MKKTLFTVTNIYQKPVIGLTIAARNSVGPLAYQAPEQITFTDTALGESEDDAKTKAVEKDFSGNGGELLTRGFGLVSQIAVPIPDVLVIAAMGEIVEEQVRNANGIRVLFDNVKKNLRS